MMSYRPEKLELEPMEDEQAVMVNLYRVTKSLLAGRITEKTAGLMLWSVAIGMPGARRVRKTHHGGTEARRKTRKSLPQIHADERGSERKQAKAKRKTSETPRITPAGQNRAVRGPRWRNGVSGGKKVSRESTRMNTQDNHTHPGVTPRKSFKSGVEGGVPRRVIGQQVSRRPASCHLSKKRSL
jgi:hypothetical protein